MQDDKKRLKLAEASLTPEEEHRIEVRVDKMMQIHQDAADEPTEPAPSPAPDVPPEPVAAEVTADEPMQSAVPSAPELAAEGDEPTAEVEPEPAGVAATEAAPLETTAAEEKEPTAPNEVSEDDELAALAAEPSAAAAKPTGNDEPVIDQLAAKESAGARAEEDADIAAAFSRVDADKPHRIKKFFSRIAHSKKTRWAGLVIIILLVIAAGVLPDSRAWALNTVGMRGTAAVTIVDSDTRLPLKNVAITLGGVQGITDPHGSAKLAHVRLGKQQLTAYIMAFRTLKETVIVKTGSNELGTLKLYPSGARYRFKVTDYLSGQPVTTATATAGLNSAVADKAGLITLTVLGSNDAANPDATGFPVKVTAPGYRDQKVKVTADSNMPVQLVSSRHELFFSKQSGKYDLYREDLDGQNKKLLLAGTGTENSSLSLLPHPSASEAAIVDTRDGNHDSDGYLLQSLTLINTATGAPTSIDHSERIVLIDWIGDRLVYVLAKAGASAANPSRYQLLSYDYRTNQRLELDHANAFNDVISTASSIYYATSNQYNGGTSQFIRINADGTNKVTLLNNEVWNILRKDYSNFYLNTGSSNYTYKLGDNKPVETKDSYNNPSRLYIDSPDSQHSLWVDQRDGKGALITYTLSKQQDTVLAEQSGLTYPVRWLDNSTVIYRVKNNDETADYAVSLNGGEPKKITDVTDAAGRTLWYFY